MKMITRVREGSVRIRTSSISIRTVLDRSRSRGRLWSRRLCLGLRSACLRAWPSAQRGVGDLDLRAGVDVLTRSLAPDQPK